ncbi:MAG: hypothetical protein AUJ85_08090 [Elusimicrobia bacterium CG1_02_37_114]|nr:MAG: hypothetical protein AUJ85_08090 [Elusimicrobia bacterium CG1_02_37_114]PIV52968.1 MAG: hypothetical protein COS17_06420 [Elusimicrobia bacterium CG02_land_8_20_14_3_00_37_13]PIZ13784.1 MAG: hypothetical protein COY53_03060 [Elusimicrobia bacterium CG_4_10_14_0_8_um_filter_37_32]
MNLQFINKEDILTVLKILSIDNNIYYLTNNLSYEKLSKDEVIPELNIDSVRSLVPLKSFLLTHIDQLKEPKIPKKSNIVFGAKSCDIKARKILDNMFLADPQDPYYEVRNKSTLIFSSDCPDPQKTCFCTYIKGKPYPEDGFDLNFSPVHNGYVVEIGSVKGQKIVDQVQTYFKDTSKEQLSGRDKMRESAIEKLEQINKDFNKVKDTDLQKLFETKFHSDKWKELSKTCVQCYGCTNICPSCYCFFLAESNKSKENPFEKVRYWDSCQVTGYGRVGGGLNPRPKLYERFRNRYECKLNWRMVNFNMYACTGCGRCIDVCPGKIDIRKVVSELI